MFQTLSLYIRAIFWFLAAFPQLAKILLAIGKWQRDQDYKNVLAEVKALRLSIEGNMSVLGTVELLLSVTGKLLDKLPDYDQRKKEKFNKLQKEYNEEITKEYPQRDDNKLANLRDEIKIFTSTFIKEIQ